MSSDTGSVSRRTVLKGIAGAAVAGGVAALVGEELSSSRPSSGRSSPSPSPKPKVTNSQGERPYSFAGHLHSSFSEYGGSNEAQAVQARENGLDAVAMTEHDWLLMFEASRPGFPFTAMSSTESDGVWELKRGSIGAVGPASNVAIDTGSTYPSGGALLMTVTSNGGLAQLAYGLYCSPPGWGYRGNVRGRTISIDVFPERASTPEGGYLAFVTELSFHPSIAGNPLQIYWRLNTDVTTKQYSVERGVGYVDIPATVGKLQTITPDPAVDFVQLWPHVDPFDNAYFQLGCAAVATSGDAIAQGWFSNLRFVTDPTYDATSAIGGQQTVAAQAFSSFAPSVLLVPGMELSRDVHVRQLDGTMFIPDYPAGPFSLDPSAVVPFTTNMVSQIHAHASTAVVCHPYGTPLDHAMLSESQQNLRLKEVSTQLTACGVYGADAIEAGYQNRNGVDIEHHQMLWRILSRRGHVLTADGVSDDHTGRSWSTQNNRFITYLWAKSRSATTLTSALSTGRAYVGELSSFSGVLDLWLDNLDVVMGQVSLLNGAGKAARTLWVRADGLPAGSQLYVWRGPVDYSESTPVSSDGMLDDGGVLVGGSPVEASRFEAGPVAFKVDTSTSCFFWVNVLDATGRTIAFSNMIYQMREPPPAGQPSPPSIRVVTR
jgi:hypothetical protein